MSSSSVVAIRTHVHFRHMEPSPLPTADFVDNINQLFDVLNSACFCQKTSGKSHCHRNRLTSINTLMNVLLGLGIGVLFIQSLVLQKRLCPVKLVFSRVSEECTLLLMNYFKSMLSSTCSNRLLINTPSKFYCHCLTKGINSDTRTTVEYQSSVKHIAVNWILQ